MIPLNGKKTHPLRPASIAALRRLAAQDLWPHEMNAGVRDRLERGALATWAYNEKGFPLWSITDAGRAALAEIDAIKIESEFAILDVLGGRDKLYQHFKDGKDGVKVTIVATITHAWGNDDGVSREFGCQVESVTVIEE